jgi:hypothetical protein
MCSRAVRCGGRESAQHGTTSYGLRYGLPTPVYWNPMARRGHSRIVTRPETIVPYYLVVNSAS